MECPICHSNNHHLATICTSCGGYLRNKVDNLDLFSMMGKVIVSPRSAMERVALAAHKNYVIVLSSAGGIAIAFYLMALLHFGEILVTLPLIVGAGFAFGMMFGILLALSASFYIVLAGRVIGTVVRFRDAFAIVSYSFVPVGLSITVLLPIGVMTYGLYLFTREPSAYSLNPLSFTLLSGLTMLAGFWSLWTYFTGVRLVCNTSRGVAGLIGSIPVALLATLVVLWMIYSPFPASGT